MHTTMLEVEVPLEWVKFVTDWLDGFASNVYGYWARGVLQEHDSWLVWEDDEKCRHGKEPNREVAVRAFHQTRNAPLPPKWFRFDQALAIRAYVEGVKLWGLNWYNSPKTDAIRYDVAIQMALFGEVKYG